MKFWDDDAIQAKVDQEDDPKGEVIQKIAHDKVKEQTHVIIKKLENHMDQISDKVSEVTEKYQESTRISRKRKKLQPWSLAKKAITQNFYSYEFKIRGVLTLSKKNPLNLRKKLKNMPRCWKIWKYFFKFWDKIAEIMEHLQIAILEGRYGRNTWDEKENSPKTPNYKMRFTVNWRMAEYTSKFLENFCIFVQKFLDAKNLQIA